MNTDKIYAEQLANEYAPKDTSKVVALRKLDAKAKLPATIFTYTFGIITALITGVGMCLSMKVIGSGTTFTFILGIIIGIIGLVGMGIFHKKRLYNRRIFERCYSRKYSSSIHGASYNSNFKRRKCFCMFGCRKERSGGRK